MSRSTQGGAALPVTITGTEDGASAIPVTIASSSVAQIVEQATYTTVLNGELQGSATALQMPNVACKLVKFKALIDNAGNVYFGAAGVTIPNGTSDFTSGWLLDAGEETGWIPVDNLNRFYYICTNAGDDFVYLALR